MLNHVISHSCHQSLATYGHAWIIPQLDNLYMDNQEYTVIYNF